MSESRLFGLRASFGRPAKAFLLDPAWELSWWASVVGVVVGVCTNLEMCNKKNKMTSANEFSVVKGKYARMCVACD
jgi:hypothetical protein